MHCKLAVLGDGGVGKTALTIRLCLNYFVEAYDPTIEDSYRKQMMVDGEPVVIEVLDTAGQEEYTALRDQWIREGDGFLLIYSIASRSSFERIQVFHEEIRLVKDDLDRSVREKKAPLPIVVIGNKCDVLDRDRQVSLEEGSRLATTLGSYPFYETSAKLGLNVESAFVNAVQLVQNLQVGSQNAARRPSGSSRRKFWTHRCVIL